MSLGIRPSSAEKAVSSLLLMLRLTTISVVFIARSTLYYSLCWDISFSYITRLMTHYLRKTKSSGERMPDSANQLQPEYL